MKTSEVFAHVHMAIFSLFSALPLIGQSDRISYGRERKTHVFPSLGRFSVSVFFFIPKQSIFTHFHIRNVCRLLFFREFFEQKNCRKKSITHFHLIYVQIIVFSGHFPFVFVKILYLFHSSFPEILLSGRFRFEKELKHFAFVFSLSCPTGI